MNVHRLSFATITILADDLAEVVVDHGVDMSEAMVNEYHAFLRSHLSAPFSLLINKINSYSYDFAAQESLASIPEIERMAVVAYKQTTANVTRLLTTIPRQYAWRLEIFSDRDAALAWLMERHADRE